MKPEDRQIGLFDALDQSSLPPSVQKLRPEPDNRPTFENQKIEIIPTKERTKLFQEMKRSRNRMENKQNVTKVIAKFNSNEMAALIPQLQQKIDVYAENLITANTQLQQAEDRAEYHYLRYKEEKRLREAAEKQIERLSELFGRSVSILEEFLAREDEQNREKLNHVLQEMAIHSANSAKVQNGRTHATPQENEETEQPEQDADRLLRIRDVLKIIPVSKSAFFAGVKNGIYPKPHKLGRRAVAWSEKELLAAVDHLNVKEG